MLQQLMPNPNLSLPMTMRIGQPLTNNPKSFKKRLLKLPLKSMTPKVSNRSQCFTISMRKTGTNWPLRRTKWCTYPTKSVTKKAGQSVSTRKAKKATFPATTWNLKSRPQLSQQIKMRWQMARTTKNHMSNQSDQSQKKFLGRLLGLVCNLRSLHNSLHSLPQCQLVSVQLLPAGIGAY